ncbi:MAG: hypothetical protein HC850_05630 [Rhodomicrobium sp.]|nr:hypothetical protein [Rhodomicrobium sp.]
MTLFSRRSFIAGSAALALKAFCLPAAGAELSEDGLYQQPWFLQSFLTLKDDFQGAQANGRAIQRIRPVTALMASARSSR